MLDGSAVRRGQRMPPPTPNHAQNKRFGKVLDGFFSRRPTRQAQPVDAFSLLKLAGHRARARRICRTRSADHLRRRQ